MINYKFKHPPILIGGKAMEFYKLRKSGDDIDFVISKVDYNALSKIYPPNHFMPSQTPAITVKNKIDTDYFLHLYNLDYDALKINSIKHNNMLVISKIDLILLKSMTAFDKKNKIGISTKNKNLKDISLLVNSFI